ncbi:hypothetical protein M9434_002776 [Picochlorum sp. BPE23]|nr:hypothetical protein M9434_002776 [Picochlorum sp. BPE23]
MPFMKITVIFVLALSAAETVRGQVATTEERLTYVSAGESDTVATSDDLSLDAEERITATCVIQGLGTAVSEIRWVYKLFRGQCIYGNYCGPSCEGVSGGKKFKLKPRDSTDACCRAHDIDLANADAKWSSSDACPAHQSLISCLDRVKSTTATKLSKIFRLLSEECLECEQDNEYEYEYEDEYEYEYSK